MAKDSAEVQAADAGARRKAIVLILIGGVVGAGSILWFEGSRAAFEGWLSGDGDIDEGGLRMRIALTVLALAGTLPLLGFSGYLRRFAARIESSQRFPPAGVAVVKDTKVLEGADALAHAHRLRLLAWAILILALMIPVVMWRVASVLPA